MKNLEYKLEAYAGESIKEYAKRLIELFREVSKNKLACYAEFVSGKRSAVVGEFNDIKLTVDSHKVTIDDIIDYYNKKIKRA